MEVRMDEGSQNENDNFDLSAYGGTKPEFHIKENDDNHVIEDMNSKLLGLQIGGEKELFENAKNQGINNILSNNQPMQMQNMQQGGHNNQGGNNNQGLNMSFNNNSNNNNNNNMQQSMNNGMNGGMNGGMNNGMNGGMNNGMNNTNKVNFDSNIKIIELDTKVSDGFFYSGSKNLDPFRN